MAVSSGLSLTMQVFPVNWLARDVDEKYTITLFGKTPDRTLVAVNIQFYPHFYVEQPANADATDIQAFIWSESRSIQGVVKDYCKPKECVSMWGFTNTKNVKVVLLAFSSLKYMKIAAAKLRQHHRTFESKKVDPLLRFFHVTNIAPSQWVSIKSYDKVPQDQKATRADVEIRAMIDDVGPGNLTTCPPLIIASWDLETYSKARKFPCADKEEDVIIQIATSFMRYGEQEPYKQVVMCFQETDKVPGIEVVNFTDEADMINSWFQLVEDERADVLLGYNTDQVGVLSRLPVKHTMLQDYNQCQLQFDYSYLIGRTNVLVDDETGESLVDLSKMGRMLHGGGEVLTKELNSSAYGNNKFCTVSAPGMLNLDLMRYVMKEHKLDSYSLNSVSHKFLGDSKIDLPAWEIFDRFDGSPADRALIAEYAAKDTLLPLKLLNKLNVYQNLMEMANATFVPVNFVLERGQQIKVFSALMKKARSMGFICPDDVGIEIEGKFAGATVLEARAGGYFDIVAGLDFASRE